MRGERVPDRERSRRARLLPLFTRMRPRIGRGGAMSSEEELARRNDPEVIILRHHAGTLNNIGAILYQRGAHVDAMKMFQESVKALMQAEADDKGSGGWPTPKRQDEMTQYLKALYADDALTTIPAEVGESAEAPSEPTDGRNGIPHVPKTNDGLIQPERRFLGIPGIFESTTKLSHSRKEVASVEKTPLTFSDPFILELDETSQKDDSQQPRNDYLIGSERCSECTLFNMGLVHYVWGGLESAVQFFELSISVSPHPSPRTPIALSPVLLACLNNIGQINCQRGRTSEAMGVISDALTRGNAALAQFYMQQQPDEGKQEPPSAATTTSKTSKQEMALHRFLARTLMNIGQVHYSLCNFAEATRACQDALRLLHPSVEDVDAASLWYNKGLLYQHQKERANALDRYNKFLILAEPLVGPDHSQIATALHNMGVIHYEKGQLHQSMKPLVRSLHIRQYKYPEAHPSLAESLHLIGKVLHDREAFGDAMFVYQKALAIQRELSDDTDSSLEVAQILMDVGRVHHILGAFEESVNAYQEVMDISRRVFGQRHAYVARMLNIIGNLHVEQNKVADAMNLFAEAMLIHEEKSIPMDMHVVKNRLYRVKLSHSPGAASA